MQEPPSTIEMYIATSDELHRDGNDACPGLKRSLSLRVTPPRSAPPQRVSLASTGELSKTSTQSAEMRSLKNELGMTEAELRETALDLKDSERNLRYENWL